jgi:hypothetical protein
MSSCRPGEMDLYHIDIPFDESLSISNTSYNASSRKSVRTVRSKTKRDEAFRNLRAPRGIVENYLRSKPKQSDAPIIDVYDMNGHIIFRKPAQKRGSIIGTGSIKPSPTNKTNEVVHKIQKKGENSFSRTSFATYSVERSNWSSDTCAIGEQCIQFMPAPRIPQSDFDMKIDWADSVMNAKALDLIEDSLPSDYDQLKQMLNVVCLLDDVFIFKDFVGVWKTKCR